MKSHVFYIKSIKYSYFLFMQNVEAISRYSKLLYKFQSSLDKIKYLSIGLLHQLKEAITKKMDSVIKDWKKLANDMVKVIQVICSKYQKNIYIFSHIRLIYSFSMFPFNTSYNFQKFSRNFKFQHWEKRIKDTIWEFPFTLITDRLTNLYILFRVALSMSVSQFKGDEFRFIHNLSTI